MRKKHQILLHVAFWIIFNVLQYARYVALNFGNISAEFYFLVSIQILLNIITFYGAYFVVLQRLFDIDKLKLFTLLGGYIALNILVRVYISRYVFSFIVVETWLDKYNSVWLQSLFVVTYVGLSFLVRFTIYWFQNRQLKVELINQKQAAELALLRT